MSKPAPASTSEPAHHSSLPWNATAASDDYIKNDGEATLHDDLGTVLPHDYRPGHWRLKAIADSSLAFVCLLTMMNILRNCEHHDVPLC